MRDDAIAVLRCPICGGGLMLAGGAVRCTHGHSFDIARQGYASLLAGGRAAHEGDTAEMVAARERFLAGGHFGVLEEAVMQALPAGPAPPADPALPADLALPAGPALPTGPPLLVDLGAGTGWYLARALDRRPDARGVALDVSKPALRRAARAHPRMAAVACDAWGDLPLRDGVADAVLNVFAPRNGSEMARVLAPGGRVVVVTAAPAHLGELSEPLGLLAVDDSKQERLAAQLSPHLRVVDRRELEWPLELPHPAVRDLAAMGPSAFHVEPAALEERIARLPEPIEVTAAVTITVAAR